MDQTKESYIKKLSPNVNLEDESLTKLLNLVSLYESDDIYEQKIDELRINYCARYPLKETISELSEEETILPQKLSIPRVSPYSNRVYGDTFHPYANS